MYTSMINFYVFLIYFLCSVYLCCKIVIKFFLTIYLLNSKFLLSMRHIVEYLLYEAYDELYSGVVLLFDSENLK